MQEIKHTPEASNIYEVLLATTSSPLSRFSNPFDTSTELDMSPQQFESQAQAARELQFARGINKSVDASALDKHNQSGIVEVHAHFVVTKSDGAKAFELEAIWGIASFPF